MDIITASCRPTHATRVTRGAAPVRSHRRASLARRLGFLGSSRATCRATWMTFSLAVATGQTRAQSEWSRRRALRDVAKMTTSCALRPPMPCGGIAEARINRKRRAARRLVYCLLSQHLPIGQGPARPALLWSPSLSSRILSARPCPPMCAERNGVRGGAACGAGVWRPQVSSRKREESRKRCEEEMLYVHSPPLSPRGAEFR
mmetsp:Transcript_29617/g.76512  ORF Transcript_29617/g.76512 Transcript_29617/m.76512 type:complete len:203 (-) Transcript_29617:111-719(-)